VSERRSVDAFRGKVYDHLKKMINAHKLEPGQFIDLNLIGEELGMSRTPHYFSRMEP
jgi:DNA-binding GntR family transcriptional regulator